MSQQERSSRMAVLLFTDIVDSVSLQERLGAVAYARLFALHVQLLDQALQSVTGGLVRNSTGDGRLCEFDTAAGAVNAALLFQMLLRKTKWEIEAPRVRIGIAQGQIQLDATSDGQPAGLPVSMASRVMNLAQGGQIFLTRPAYDDARHFVRAHPVAWAMASPPPAVKWVSHGEYKIKGIDHPVEICEVGAVGFAPFTPPPDNDKARSSLVLPRKKATRRSPVLGAGLAVLCGLVLWGNLLGDGWENASYDYLFLFATRAVPETNKPVLVLMDKEARGALDQKTDKPWDRGLHTELLNQLAAQGCRLVVFDVNFDSHGKQDVDAALVAAMRRQSNVVLMAEVGHPQAPRLLIGTINSPKESFASAAIKWGIGNAGVPLLGTPRRHYPFPSPDKDPSLAWVAARMVGAELSERPEERWLRYYGEKGGWDPYSYHLAPTNTPHYFSNRVVFIGADPMEIHNPEHLEDDKFCTPYTRWTGDAAGGVQIMATTYLNLINGDWLRRPDGWLEALILMVTGTLLGGGLCLVRTWLAWLIAAGAFVAVAVGAVCLSYFNDYWFPWLVIAGGQVPCALAWALIPAGIRRETLAPAQAPEAAAALPEPAVAVSEPPAAIIAPPVPAASFARPDAPEFQLFDPPFGEGGFGKVWLVRNATGEWQALKAVYRSKFGDDTGPYDTEFRGIQNYKPVSKKHPGLLAVDFVSKQKPEGYFYYVMELGDSQAPGWEENPAAYKPWNLEFLRTASPGGRVPLMDCVRIGLALADALDFLHRQELIHRDIKPSNVIFVKGQPKFADVGLMTNIRPLSQIHTWAGTKGYMPPSPNEPPGTVAADIFALGMLLYVISTGHEPTPGPVLATTLLQTATQADYMRLNAIILKACQPDPGQRYASAAEMSEALREAEEHFTAEPLSEGGTMPG